MSIFKRKQKEEKATCKFCGYQWKDEDKRSITTFYDLGPFCSVCFNNAMKLGYENKK